MSTNLIAKIITYTVSPSDSIGIYRLSVTIDNNAPIALQSSNILFLARLGRIIAYNRMPHHKASKLCDAVCNGSIPMGHLPNSYLYPGPAYRVILSFGGVDGFVCAHYATPEEAFNDPLIQQEIDEASEKFAYKYDYNEYLSVIELGQPYTIMHYTILRSRIRSQGGIGRCAGLRIHEEDFSDVF